MTRATYYKFSPSLSRTGLRYFSRSFSERGRKASAREISRPYSRRSSGNNPREGICRSQQVQAAEIIKCGRFFATLGWIPGRSSSLSYARKTSFPATSSPNRRRRISVHRQGLRTECGIFHSFHRLSARDDPEGGGDPSSEGGYAHEAIQGEEPRLAGAVCVYPVVQIRQRAGGLGKEHVAGKVPSFQDLQDLCAGGHSGTQTDGGGLPDAGGILLYQ